MRTETNNVIVIMSCSFEIKNHTIAERPTTRRSEPTQVQTITCYNCEKQDHRARECRLPRQPTCYECGIKRYIRRECPRFNYTRCYHRGHSAKECFTNLNREYQLKQR